MQKFLSYLWEIAKIVIIALVIVIPVRYFVFQPFVVRGSSMEPNFQNNNYLIVDEISYRFQSPRRGEVVVFALSPHSFQHLIKRVIGLPGEEVEIKDGIVLINQEPLDESSYLSQVQTSGSVKISLKEGQYFMLGDNRSGSYDSRRWGALEKKNIVGRALFKLWPLDAWAKIEAPAY